MSFAVMIVRGVLLGLGAAAPIGPVNAEIARRVLHRGWFAGVMLGLGAVCVDVTYAILSAMSLGRVLARPSAQAVIGVCGGALLAWLGFRSLRAVWRSLRERKHERAQPWGQPTSPEPCGNLPTPPWRNFLTGILMTATNPMTLLFWVTVVPAAGGGESGGAGTHLLLITIGVMAGAVAWVFAFSGLVRLLAAWKRAALFLIADAAGGIILLGFALAAIWRVGRMVIT